MFPIGDLDKKEVRLIAKQQNLITAEKKDSQGLCFVGKVKLPEFLQQKLKVKKGKVILISKNNEIFNSVSDPNDFSVQNLKLMSNPYNYSIDKGSVIGNHDGAHFFTIGQRKGLAIGGTKEPLFVIGTDVVNNLVYVGEGKNHPGLYRKVLFVLEKNFHRLREDYDYTGSKLFDTRIRYRQPLQKSQLVFTENGTFFIFDKPQSSITKGQFVVWYNGDELIGSGVID